MKGTMVASERQWYRQAARRQPAASQFWAQLQRTWSQVAQFLSQDSEPRLWTKVDRQGRLRWYARDPVTGNSLAQASEHEVRVWLEQRYHR